MSCTKRKTHLPKLFSNLDMLFKKYGKVFMQDFLLDFMQNKKIIIIINICTYYMHMAAYCMYSLAIIYFCYVLCITITKRWIVVIFIAIFSFDLFYFFWNVDGGIFLLCIIKRRLYFFFLCSVLCILSFFVISLYFFSTSFLHTHL